MNAVRPTIISFIGPAYRRFSRAAVLAALLPMMCLVTAMFDSVARAHECDQYSVPIGKQFADLSDYISDLAYEALNEGMEKTNDKIRKAIARRAPQAEIDALYSEDEIANNVYRAFPNAVVLIEELESFVEKKSNRRKYPGRVVGFQDFSYIYDNNFFPLDPRQVFKIWRASTILVHGVYMGTDKIGHFTDMGMNYYKKYRSSIKDGKNHEQAMKDVLDFAGNDAILGERGLIGFVSSGVYSNADLAANYSGMKFYMNLTKPMMIAGETRPPLLVRDGDYYKLAPHVAKDSDFFLVFFTPHFDEALNPSLHVKGMRDAVRKAIEKRADKVRAWYSDANGMERTADYFQNLVDELRTYYGEDYGWWAGDDGEILTTANTCFPPIRNEVGEGSIHAAQLIESAYEGDPEMVRVAIADGANVNARITPASHYSNEAGNTALHLAARRGAADELHLLIEAGADVAAINERHVTPLHMAAHRPTAAANLLDADAPVNALDDANRSPLHWAANVGNAQVVATLLDHDADVTLRDRNDQTALHLAAQQGSVECIAALLDHGADVNASARYNTTPLHLAALKNNAAAVKLLLERGANANAADEFGMTPLHDAARLGHIDTVRALLDGGANANAKDAYSTTPLHLAARHDRPTVARLLLEHGADPGAGNNFGNSPTEEAKRMKSEVTAKLFADWSKR